MTRFALLTAAVILSACAQGSAPSRQQPLDFAACERLAKETFDAGKLRYDLCPGYMPDGQKIELF